MSAIPSWLPSVVLLAVAYALSILAGHAIVRGILARFPTDEGKKAEGIEGAGMAIGILERIFTLTFVLLDQYAAIALIFTAKSIARFEELKDRQFSEYYLIGTLSSILVALVIGIIARILIEGGLW